MTMAFLDPAALSRPVYQSLADQIARAIADGRLANGAQLPPHRILAHELKISVQTVSRAYEELIRRGLVSGETGRGSFVRRQEPASDVPYLEERPGETIDLSILKPVCETMHLDRMKAVLAEMAVDLPASAALSFRPNVIFPGHRAVAVEWLRHCGVEASPGNVILTNGATAGMTVAMMSAASTGTVIATETLGHHTLVPLASYLGLKMAGVAIDDEGMVPEALAALCRQEDVRAVFLQPSPINPSASMMGLARREALIAVARENALSIIENDPLGPLIEDRPPPVAALAPERTLYVTTFTKSVLPGLRTGYLVAPDRLMPAVANRHLVSHWIATPLLAEVASRWVRDGTAMDLVRWQRKALARRQATVAEMLAGIDHRAHPMGLHVWLPLRSRTEEEVFVAQARLRGVALAPGRSFQIGRDEHPAVRIAVGSASEAELKAGLRVVAGLYHAAPEPLLLAI
ncbi:PLP-dependent aminotransferase family protein [Jiella sonneratiae]|uniref:PLP-dependent aminotransferase family protein n=1 Tax=Jiella sonneratiae TaxID=2816856 RepID=A0ABS3IZT5_9HYPH|nr:PLP-dependent aminotransferase family protein [Jiella sonneratiae]MBO0902928.1 PLP-dependent aminotransferase family protein [Jiella sonneratiae]